MDTPQDVLFKAEVVIAVRAPGQVLADFGDLLVGELPVEIAIELVNRFLAVKHGLHVP
jgi:hypothetical protein